VSVWRLALANIPPAGLHVTVYSWASFCKCNVGQWCKQGLPRPRLNKRRLYGPTAWLPNSPTPPLCPAVLYSCQLHVCTLVALMPLYDSAGGGETVSLVRRLITQLGPHNTVNLRHLELQVGGGSFQH
jgi:hypothetical protein